MKKERHRIWLPYLLAGLLGALTVIIGLLFTNREPSKTLNTTGQGQIVNLTNNKNQPATDAYEIIKNSVVTVVNLQRDLKNDGELVDAAEGSGVVYQIDDKIAYIVTNNHVVERNRAIQILLPNGTRVDGDVIGTDRTNDLAVIKINSNQVKKLKAADFADSDQVTTGEQVLAIGSPMGLEFATSVTRGIVSAVNRPIEMEDLGLNSTVIQTDAPTNPGNSGGALINYRGQVIGINSLKLAGSMFAGGSIEGMSFAIESNIVKDSVNQMIGEDR